MINNSMIFIKFHHCYTESLTLIVFLSIPQAEHNFLQQVVLSVKGHLASIDKSLLYIARAHPNPSARSPPATNCSTCP